MYFVHETLFCSITGVTGVDPNLNFVARIPKQFETTTVHFPEVSGGTYQK